MKKISKKDLLQMLDLYRSGSKNKGENICLQDISFREIFLENEDLKNLDLSGIDFSWSDFKNIDFRNCNFDGSIFDHSKFCESDLSRASFKNSSLFGVDLRGCNLEEAICDGTDFTESVLVGANLKDLYYTDKTVHFEIHCPKVGYFFGYKKCFNNRMVKLLIPKDAKRCSSTTNACRCDKAKVVSITDISGKIFYDEAISYVDENFVYKLGEMVYADSYNEDRWLDSSHGIHFWMTFEEALGYM